MAEPYRASLNGIIYPVREWQTVENGQLLTEEWTEGLAGGMGEFSRKSRDRYYYAGEVDCSQDYYIRLRRKWQNLTAIVGGDTTIPAYAFIAQDGAGTEYIYVVNGRTAYKFSADGATLHSTKDFGAGAAVGRPALFNGTNYVPLGASVDYVKLTAVGVGAAADTWTSVVATGKALHFAAATKDAVGYLARGHSTNNVALSSDGTNWGDNFQVGNSSSAITDMLTWQNQLAVVKTDNAYSFDERGNSFPVQNFITESSVGNNGANSATYGGYLFWPIQGRLWRVVGGRAAAVDPSALPGFISTPLRFSDSGTTFMDTDIPTNLRVASVAVWGKWLYWSRKGAVYFGLVQSDGSVLWHGQLIGGGSNLRLAIVTLATLGPTLVVVGATGQFVGFIHLDDDGGMRGTVGNDSRGAASTTSFLYFPELDFGLPDKTKQARRIWMNVEALPAGCVVRVTTSLEGSTTSHVAIGADITATGVTERTWTPGSQDTFTRLALTIRFVTDGTYSTSNDPRIRSIGVEAATPTVYRCVIPCTVSGLAGTNLDINTARQNLRNLRNGASITVIEPLPTDPDGTGASFTAYITSHMEQVTAAEGGGSIFTLMVERFNYGS